MELLFHCSTTERQHFSLEIKAPSANCLVTCCDGLKWRLHVTHAYRQSEWHTGAEVTPRRPKRGGGCQSWSAVVGQSSLWRRGERRRARRRSSSSAWRGWRWTPREVIGSHHHQQQQRLRDPGSRSAGWIWLSWESSATVAVQWLWMGLTWTAPYQTQLTPSWTARRGLPQLWGVSSSSLRSLTSWATSWSSSPFIGTKSSGTQVSPGKVCARGARAARAWLLS